MLTDAKIRNSKPRERPYRLSDSLGMCLVIQPTGGKLFQVRYRVGGKERTYSIGPYPEVTLAKARAERDRVRGELHLGLDPVHERRLKKEAGKVAADNSFEKVALSWFEHWSVGKSQRHAGYVLRRLEADVFPAIGKRAVGDISAPELVALLRAMQERGVSDLAKRAHQVCSQIFRFSVAHGLTGRNPAADFRPGDVISTPQKRNFARISAKDLPELLRAIEAYPGTPITRIAIKLLALTFVRTSELIGARWDEVDFDAKRWNIPAERMKMRDPHIVPLSSQALNQLRILHAVTGRGHLLFPGEGKKGRPISNNTILKALERMGYKGKMTGHGFRGLASTVLHEQGFDHLHIEAQLAHQERNRVSAAYNHAKYLSQRTQMMQAWGDYLDVAMCGAND
jgi:integrase